MSRVTLTFDNGPSSDTTPFVLEQLRQRGLSAWFCVVGKQLQAAREHVDIAIETRRLGHQIVNHSLTHGVALGDDPTEAHASQEVVTMHHLMAEQLGDWGERWFRPFGRGGKLGQHIFSEPALEHLQALNYSVLLWNCVPRDWVDTAGWVETALASIREQEHSVVVLHDLDTGAMAHLPRFLDELASADIEITHTPSLDCVPLLHGEHAIPTPAMRELTAPA